jgi:hypothetical protein
MSKSKGNVVDPDSMIREVRLDALRLYVMFVAPPEKEVEWTTPGWKAASASWRACGAPPISGATTRGGRDRAIEHATLTAPSGAAPQDPRHHQARDASTSTCGSR